MKFKEPEEKPKEVVLEDKKLRAIYNTIAAYSDCNDIADEDTPRDLGFKSEAGFSLSEWENIMSLAVPRGYNAFKVSYAKTCIEKAAGVTDLRFYPAREGSVCVYIETRGHNHSEGFMNALRKLTNHKVDELSVTADGQVRLWWD